MIERSQRFQFWRRWLLAGTSELILFGSVLMFAPDLSRSLFSLLLYRSASAVNRFASEAVSYITFVHTVLGAVIVGWGTALFFIVVGPFRRASREAWYALAVSVAVWFVSDTAFSVWSGFWQNGVLNVAMVALFVVPLAATYHVCHESDA
ncbi:MAG: hypothetical protein U0236_05215 [Nitrospira sp.]